MLNPRLTHEALSMGASLAGLPLPDLVARCAHYGDTTPDRLAALLWSPVPPTPHEHDVVAVALNEYFADEGMDHPVATSWHLTASTT